MTSKVIQVFARFRPPLFADEIGQPYCVKFVENSVLIQHDKLKRVMQFDFDGAMPPETSQAEVYQKVGAKLLNDVLAGYNCTLMTYGQTGSGKSFTMEGKNFKDQPDLKEGEELDPMSGVVPRLIEDIFKRLVAEQQANPEFSFTVSASYVEVYRGDLVDCLIPKEAAAGAGWGAGDGASGKQSKVEVRFPDAAAKATPRLCGHTIVNCPDRATLRKIYQKGCAGRVVEATNANPVSSRGHGIFDINITQILGLTSTRTSLFRIVDLAGSEQAENTGQDAARQREAKAINTSLAMLGGVVLGLSQNEAFINYRRDILTRVLEESLGKGNKAILVVTGKPTMNNVKSTLNSLRFASTASFVQGDLFKNEKQTYAQLERGIFDRDALLKAKDDEIRELQAKMAKLLADLSEGGGAGGEDAGKLKTALAELQGELLAVQDKAEQRETELRAIQARIEAEAKNPSAASGGQASSQATQSSATPSGNGATKAATSASKSRGPLSSSSGGQVSIGDEAKLEREGSASDLMPEKAPPVITPEAISAYSHTETQILDDLKQACSPQPASYEAEDMLKLYDQMNSGMPEATEALVVVPADMPSEARDGQLHRTGNLLMSGLLSVLIDKNNTKWPPVPVCPAGAFVVCPKCHNTNVRSASTCVFCIKMKSRKDNNLSLGPASPAASPSSASSAPPSTPNSKSPPPPPPLSPATAVPPLSSTPATPGPASGGGDAAAPATPSSPAVSADGKELTPSAHHSSEPPPNVKIPASLPPKRPSMILKLDLEKNGMSTSTARGWIPAYFEVSVELQSLLVFFRKTGPQLGDTVRVKTNSGERTGVIRYVGRTAFAEGEWMGLELPDDKGKNDGSVKGKVYFECQPNHGLFVQPSAIVEHIDGKGSWELCASLPLVHASIQPLTKDDYEFFPLTFSVHTMGGSTPWVFRALSEQAFSRWMNMLGDYSSIWSDQESRVQKVRSLQDASTFVSGMLRLLRADGAGWQKLFCQVRTEEGIFECFDMENLDADSEEGAFKTTPVCLCPILTCEASRVNYETEGPKRHVFMLKPQWVWKQDAPPRVERALSGGNLDSPPTEAVKARSMSFFSRPGAKSVTPTRTLSVSTRALVMHTGEGRGEKSDAPCLLLMADSERELDRWVENLKLLQQFKANEKTAATSSGRRRGSLMVSDSKLEGHMKSKQSKVFASWHPCYCVLTQTGQLQIYQAKHRGAGQVYVVSSMIVTEVHIPKEKSKGFVLFPKGGEAKDGFMLSCADISEHQAWVDALAPRDTKAS